MVRLYMDVHVPGAVTRALQMRGVDVLTAQQDGADQLEDPDLLDRAGELGHVLFTQDDDLLAEAAARQSGGKHFCGVIYLHQLNLTLGRCIEDLQLIAEACEAAEFEGRVWYLPLR